MLIGARYCGPPNSGNGGYSSGLIATALGVDGPVQVTLRTPPPLDQELTSHRTADGVEVRDGDVLVGEARPADLDLEVVDPVPLSDAEAAATRFVSVHEHPYPTCFVCGPERAEGDGLRLLTGPVDGREVVAAPWTPHPSVADGDTVRPEVLWAALDCPSWFGFSAFEEHEGRPLLGRITARLDSLPRVGDPCVAVGWRIARDGRKVHTASAVFGADGRIHGRAASTWILVEA